MKASDRPNKAKPIEIFRIVGVTFPATASIVLSNGNEMTRRPQISLATRRNKPTLIHFWAADCYNCKNNMPSYKPSYEEFELQDAEIVAIHTSETMEEPRPAFVAQHIQKRGIKWAGAFRGHLHEA